MRNTFYKIKFKDFKGQDIERTHINISDMKKDYNILLQTSGISNVKIFIVNEIEEELMHNQIFN